MANFTLAAILRAPIIPFLRSPTCATAAANVPPLASSLLADRRARRCLSGRQPASARADGQTDTFGAIAFGFISHSSPARLLCLLRERGSRLPVARVQRNDPSRFAPRLESHALASDLNT